MRKIVFGFCALTVATWLLNLGFNPPAMNGRSLTHEVFFLNGVLAWGLMAMAIVIAARPAWLEKVTATPLDELQMASHARHLGGGAHAFPLLYERRDASGSFSLHA